MTMLQLIIKKQYKNNALENIHKELNKLIKLNFNKNLIG